MPIYLIYLLIFFVIPSLVLGLIYRKEITKYKRTIFWSFVFVYTIGWFWDWLSYKTGVWRYDSAPTLGIWLSGISIEEFIGFYIFGTLLIIFTIITLIKKLYVR